MHNIILRGFHPWPNSQGEAEMSRESAKPSRRAVIASIAGATTIGAIPVIAVAPAAVVAAIEAAPAEPLSPAARRVYVDWLNDFTGRQCRETWRELDERRAAGAPALGGWSGRHLEEYELARSADLEQYARALSPEAREQLFQAENFYAHLHNSAV
jgi:hypothetical protein